MSLATRCPACDTCFKVVPDQLRLAQGWVRCGRCDEVFLATDHLIEAPEPPPSLMGTALPESAAEPLTTAPLTAPAIEELPLTEIRPGLGVAATRSTASTLPAAAPEPVKRYVWDTAAPASAPRQPVRTALWLTAAGVAAAALALQAAHAWRHDIASHQPATRPALEALCRWVDCRVEPVRRLSDLSVESSQLSQWGGTIYRIALVLRNRADVPLMLPMLDLTLTDVRGAVVARKAVALSDFGVTAATLGARQELSLQGYLNAGDTGVAGYTIELFHP